MRHRIFLAINLPDNVKQKLSEYQKRWPELPVRWTKKENLHITLVFLGYATDEETAEVCEIVKETAPKHSPFFIKLNKILYGPSKKMPPRMVWARGEGAKECLSLQNSLAKALSFQEERSFSPHITLGRIKTWEWRKLEEEERQDIAEDIDLSFKVNSVEVMESQLKKGGPVYTVLESCQLS